jgi:hypothetical protein
MMIGSAGANSLRAARSRTRLKVPLSASGAFSRSDFFGRDGRGKLGRNRKAPQPVAILADEQMEPIEAVSL